MPDIPQPTLLLHGARDTLMPLSSAKWLQKNMPQAQLAILPEASHAPFLSDTLKSADIVTEFLHANA
jgi:pimeloyl-[acyl-carrier protein] methyl ester esterase